MSGQAFIKFYPSDWLGGTRGLTAAEAGIYITLVCLMYERGAPVEEDHGRLARQCGCPKAPFVRGLENLIEQRKIIRTEAGLWNARVEKELGNLSVRRENATIAATQRWSEPKQKTKEKQRPADAPASATQCVKNAKPEARSQIAREEISTGSVSSTQAAREAQDFREQVLAAAGIDLGADRNPARWLGTEPLIAIQRWRDLGLTGEEILAEVCRVAARARHPPSRLSYFDPAMQELAGLKRAPPLEPVPPAAPPSNGARHDRPARAQITPGEQSMLRRVALRADRVARLEAVLGVGGEPPDAGGGDGLAAPEPERTGRTARGD